MAMSGETILLGAKGPNEDPHVSEFKVMRSAAGWYIGTTYTHCGECDSCKEEGMPKGFSEPNTRETGYFKSKEEADSALVSL